MGAWDATSFGNDTANDWAYELEECSNLAHIEATLRKILEQGEHYIEAPDSEEAIAAAEVLAWLCGKPSPVNAYTEKVAEWVAAHPQEPSAELKQDALSVLDRIKRAPSELAELWEDDPAWAASLADLRSRLTI